MAENAEPFAHAVAQALGRAIGVPVEFVVDFPGRNASRCSTTAR